MIKWDVLFIVDNSGSMAEEQALLMKAFPRLYQHLRNPDTGALPDLHIGTAQRRTPRSSTPVRPTSTPSWAP